MREDTAFGFFLGALFASVIILAMTLLNDNDGVISCAAEDEVPVQILEDGWGFNLEEGNQLCIHIDELR